MRLTFDFGGAALRLGTVLIFSAPFLFGCQPPWASGFLVAFVLLLCASHIASRLWNGKPWVASTRLPLLIAGGLIIWLLVTVCVDAGFGPASGRVPAITVRQFCFALAFFAAALLGLSAYPDYPRLRSALRWLVLTGSILACFSLSERLGWDPKELLDYDGTGSSRPSGLYTNANRFAVLLAVCWLGGLGALAAEVLNPPSSRNSRALIVVRRVSLPAGLLLIGVALGLTLSRLTMIATAVCLSGVVAACVALQVSENQRAGGADLQSPVQKLKAYGLLLVPVAVIGGFIAWSLMVSSEELWARFTVADRDPTIAMRWAAMQATAGLVWNQPILGHGLGTFNSLFPSVQPAYLSGWWREAHSDWLQLAVEAGVPAVLLAAGVTAAWIAVCWAKMRRLNATEAGRAVPYALAVGAILVPIVCSLADFPLREPATAMLVFFLAGALCVPWGASEPRPRSFITARPVGILLCLAMILAAVVSARNALAYAVSPWMLRFDLPAPVPEHVARWGWARRIDPRDPELHYGYALAVFTSARPTDSERLESALRAVLTARGLQPHDHRFPWLAAYISALTGDLKGAEGWWEEASRLAPGNPSLHEEAGMFYLQQYVRPHEHGSQQRDRGMELVLRHLQVVLASDPESFVTKAAVISPLSPREGAAGGVLSQKESQLIEALLKAGCFYSEVAGLWPRDRPEAWMKRARFHLECSQLADAEVDLLKVEPVGPLETAWHCAFLGAIAMRRDDSVEALKWLKPLLSTTSQAWRDVDAFLAREAAGLSQKTIQDLCKAVLQQLPAYPNLANALAGKLLLTRDWAGAERILSRTAVRSANAMALWAELSLQMDDYVSAAERAKRAWTMGQPAEWYDQFKQRLHRAAASHRER